MIQLCSALFACFLLLVHPALAMDAAEQKILAEQAIRILGGNGNVIARWNRPVRLGLVGFTDEQSDRFARSTLNEIGQITGLNTAVSSWRHDKSNDYLVELNASPAYALAHCATGVTDCANLVVIMTSPEQMQRIARAIPLREIYQESLKGETTPKCFFAPFQRAYVDIVQAVVFISAGQSSEMTQTCLNEEIYQSFGMFSDVTGSRYFSFDNREEPKSITCYDKLLLQSIYSKQFQAGAPAFRVVLEFMKQAQSGHCQ